MASEPRSYRITMEDVVFLLSFLRERAPRSEDALCAIRQDAFRARAAQPHRGVADPQTIEANCLRDRGISASQFDVMALEWLRGDGRKLHDAYVESFRPDDISGCPGWAALFLDFVLPEEPRGQGFAEGETRQVLVNAYERNAAARRQCIAQYGYSCAACGVLLSDTYGEAAREFIHVHHIQPLSRAPRPRDMDPAVDLRPVCPSCHAVIHLRDPPYTIDDVKKFIFQQRSLLEHKEGR